MSAFLVKNSRWKNVALMTLTFGSAVYNAYIFSISETFNERLTIGFFIAVFALAFIFFLYQIIYSRPRIVIDDFGIFDRTLGVGEIEWHDIENIYLDSEGKKQHIYLVLKDSLKYLNRLSKTKRKFEMIESSTGLESVPLNLRGTDKTPQEVFNVLVEQLKAHRIKDLRKLGTPKLFTNNLV